MQIQFYHVGGACFVMQIDGKLTIACDPALSPAGTEYQFKSFSSVRVSPPIYEEGLFDAVHLWLITHVHEDHIDEHGIRQIAPDSTVIAHKKTLTMLSGYPDVLTVGWREAKTLSKAGYQVEVITVPAYHGNNLIMRKLVGNVNGYFLRISKGETMRTVYITADTVFHHRIADIVGKLGPIDLLVANLGEVAPDKFGGPLTMSVPMLRRMTDRLQPGKVIPIHIDDFSHYTTKSEDLVRAGFDVIEQGRWVLAV